MEPRRILIPLLMGSRLLGQTEHTLGENLEFGVTHSVYTSWCFQKPSDAFMPDEMKRKAEKPKRDIQANYGFTLGVFLWIPVNERLTLKPKAESTFSNVAFKMGSWSYARSCGISISNAFILGLTEADPDGVIHYARNMSCYLASKQPYLLFGPRISMKKYDRAFVEKGYQNEVAIGVMIGFGINYEFHGTNITKEITYTCETGRQNRYQQSSKLTHTINLAINIF